MIAMPAPTGTIMYASPGMNSHQCQDSSLFHPLRVHSSTQLANTTNTMIGVIAVRVILQNPSGSGSGIRAMSMTSSGTTQT
ncbi:hypothetical protein GCM10029964_111910 [Kibdelosporangium lantanae]